MFVTTVGQDKKVSLPVLDARTNSYSAALVGPRDRRNAIRWFVRMPEIEEAERFPCPMGYDRRTIRFEPFMLYVDSPIPPRTSVTFTRVICGPENGTIGKMSIDQWAASREEAIYWPAMPFSIGSVAPDQVVEFVGTSWWRKTPGKKRLEAWQPVERGPQLEEERIMSVYCLVRMSWLPAKTRQSRSQFQFAPKAAGRAPVAPVGARAPRVQATELESNPDRPEETRSSSDE